MDLVGLLSMIVGGLIGMLVYQTSKRNSAEALNDNAKTKEELNKVDEQIAKNNGNLESEKEKRNNIKQNEEEEKKSSNILDFFNKDNK